MDKPLSKRAQARARAEAKCVERARRQARLEALRAEAQEMVARLPEAWQGWGVTRLRGYQTLAQIVAEKAKCHSIPLERMEVYVDTLARVDRWSLDYCQYVQGLSLNAADILPPNDMRMLEPA